MNDEASILTHSSNHKEREGHKGFGSGIVDLHLRVFRALCGKEMQFFPENLSDAASHWRPEIGSLKVSL